MLLSALLSALAEADAENVLRKVVVLGGLVMVLFSASKALMPYVSGGEQCRPPMLTINEKAREIAGLRLGSRFTGRRPRPSDCARIGNLKLVQGSILLGLTAVGVSVGLLVTRDDARKR